MGLFGLITSDLVGQLMLDTIATLVTGKQSSIGNVIISHRCQRLVAKVGPRSGPTRSVEPPAASRSHKRPIQLWKMI